MLKNVDEDNLSGSSLLLTITTMKKNILKLSLATAILALASCAGSKETYEYNWDGSLIKTTKRG